MSLEVFDQIANVFILLAWPASALFVGFYYKKSPMWSRSTVGRSMMYLAVSILSLLSLGVLTNWIDHYYIEPVIRAGVYLFVTSMLWRLFYVLRLVQTGKINKDNENYSFMNSIFLRSRRNKSE